MLHGIMNKQCLADKKKLWKIILLAFLLLDYRNYIQSSISYFGNLQNIEATHSVSSYDFSSERFSAAFNARSDAFFSFPFAAELSS